MKNNRTFLEKLLDGAEVEWKPLDEVANIANNARKLVKSSLRISGNIPYYGAISKIMSRDILTMANLY